VRRRLAATCAALTIPWFAVGAIAVLVLAACNAKLASEIAAGIWVAPYFLTFAYWLLRDAAREVAAAWLDDEEGGR